MTRSVIGRLLPILAGLLLASCGAEAPTFEPGNITVRSEPAGAAIFLDGRDSGFITPHTLSGLAPAVYRISVELADFVPDRDVIPVDLKPLDDLEVDFTLSQTGFRIESPAGARILVEGVDTGRIVPAAVAGLEPGPVSVSLELDGFLFFPAQFQVDIVDKQITEIPADAFTMRAGRTVFLEGFANISCIPCPELADNLVTMTAKPGFSPDRVLFMEYAVSWPELGDPFFLANPGDNSDRFTLYDVQGAPDLYIDGARQANALDAAAMETAVLAGYEAEPGFLVDVSADFSSPSVPVTVTLTPLRDLDLTGYILFVGIYEKMIVIDPAPGLNGQTEFHHIFRDRADVVPQLGPLTAGIPQRFDLTLNSGEAGPDGYEAIAFVQQSNSLTILQAGSTAVAVLPAGERNPR